MILDQFGNMTRFAWADDRSGSFATASAVSKPGHVRNAAERGSKFRTLAAPRRT